MPMNEEVRKAVALAKSVLIQTGDSGRYPNGEGWGHVSSSYVMQIPTGAWTTIRAELTRLTEIADSVDPLVVRLEAANAEAARLSDLVEPKLRELHYDADGLRATLDGGACKALAESFAEQFSSSGAINYLDVSFTVSDGTSFLVTVQKRANPTANDLRRIAESKLDVANALLREANLYVFGRNRDLFARIAAHFTTHLSEPRT